MTKKRLTAGLQCLLIVSLNGLARADLPRQFRTDYPAHAKTLEKMYSRCKAVGIETLTNAGRVSLRRESYEFDRRDMAVRAMWTALKSDLPGYEAGSTTVFGGTAEKCFEISRPPGGQQYRVGWFGPRADFKVHARTNMAPRYAAYCVDSLRVTGLLRDPRWTLKSAKMDVLRHRSVARVELVRSADLPLGGLENLKVYFLLPSWAIAGWEDVFRNRDVPPERTDLNMTLRGYVDYSELNPVPKVSKVDRWRVRPGKRTDEMIWKVAHLQFISIPEEQFELKAFGVKEPSAPITPGQNTPSK